MPSSKHRLWCKLASLGAAVLLQGAAAQAAPVLMPQPRAISTPGGALPLPGAFHADATGCPGALTTRAVDRFQADMARQAGFGVTETAGPLLTIRCRPDVGYLSIGAREAYRLDVGASGVTLDADGPAGVLRGLATLRQLVGVGAASAVLPFVHVDDAPRFAWRGVMIDTARHFMTMPTLKRQIDAMERVKLNVLHLHLSDNEGFRVESRRYPRLQQHAHGQYYTQAEIRDLVGYAADHGVRIVPEFDVPAHTGAIVAAYPELGAKPDPASPLAALNPAINPASEATYRFVRGLYGEMAGLFPDAYFHVGGDEVGDAAWMKDPTVSAFMAAQGLHTRTDLEAYFQRRVRAILKADGKTVIGWQEIAATPIPTDVAVESWKTSNATAQAVTAGHPTVVSAGYYLDKLLPAQAYYGRDPFDLQAFGLTPADVAAAAKAHPLAGFFARDLALKPLPPLTPAQQALVLGGEMALWSELVSDEMLDARLWPRAAALAERFWSPADVADLDQLYPRLAVVQAQLEVLGLEAIASRGRMAARLAPEDPEAVLTLLSAAAPVRNGANNHSIAAYLRGQLHPPPQRLTSLADAAPTDSVSAARFNAAAARIAKGDRSETSIVRAQLAAWRANDARFQALAATKPALAEAASTSAALAVLAQAGLDALDSLDSGRPLPPETRVRAEAAVAAAQAAEAASSREILSLIQKQPPADLLLVIWPGVRDMLAAAP